MTLPAVNRNRIQQRPRGTVRPHPQTYKHKGSTRFFIMDRRLNTEFLADKGACRSFVPASPHERLNPTPPTNIHVSTASGEPLKIYRRQTMKLSFSAKQYSWMFIMADVTLALLGADFLKEHNLLVDVASEQLIPKTAPTSSPQQRIQQTVSITSATPPLEIRCLLQEFPEAFKDDLQHDLTKPAKHNVQHHIVTEGPPVHTCLRCLAPEKLAHTKQIFKEM
ncbi:uncharacterized protein [Macrobrachium rosenbergii]|uniref:uncharacterized protein n=1 Tax=Macrobrachium rosenbergii TaxID=79674 RepID=UPI0034D523CF